METDKMNESQEKDSAEAMDTQEDKKEEGDAPQGIIWSFTNQIIIISSVISGVISVSLPVMLVTIYYSESSPTIPNIDDNNIAVVTCLSYSRKLVNRVGHVLPLREKTVQISRIFEAISVAPDVDHLKLARFDDSDLLNLSNFKEPSVCRL